jgi:hypothetical protein
MTGRDGRPRFPVSRIRNLVRRRTAFAYVTSGASRILVGRLPFAPVSRVDGHLLGFNRHDCRGNPEPTPCPSVDSNHLVPSPDLYPWDCALSRGLKRRGDSHTDHLSKRTSLLMVGVLTLTSRRDHSLTPRGGSTPAVRLDHFFTTVQLSAFTCTGPTTYRHAEPAKLRAMHGVDCGYFPGPHRLLQFEGHDLPVFYLKVPRLPFRFPCCVPLSGIEPALSTAEVDDAPYIHRGLLPGVIRYPAHDG